MPEQSTLLSSLKSIFPESSWPWVIAALKHDPLVWDALSDPDLFSQVSAASLEPRDWSPHKLAMIALNIEDPGQLDEMLQADAQAALNQFLETGNLTPQQQADFKHASMLAMAMHQCYLSGDWAEIEGAMASLGVVNNGWLAPGAILFGLIPDQVKFLRELVTTAAGPATFPLVVHVVLSQPIPPRELQDLLQQVLLALSLRDAAALLDQLNIFRPELAMRLANSWLEANPPGMNGLPSPGLGDQLQQLADNLLIAQVLTLAGQLERAEQRKANSLRSLHDLQVEVSNQLVGESLRDRNIEYALSQWTRTSAAPRLTPPAGLVVELLKSGRLEDSLNILPDTDGNTQTPLRWLNNIYQALENEDLAQARLFGHQALKSFTELYDQGSSSTEKALGSRQDTYRFVSELIDRLADLALYKEAFQAAQYAALIRPGDPQTLITITKTARSAGEYPAAIQAAQLAAGLEPTYPEFRRQLAKSFEAAGDWDSALPERQAILEHRFSQPGDTTWPAVDDMLALADCALHAGQPQEAYEVCQKTVELDPADGQAHALLGEALAALGDDGQAMEHFSLATQLAPHKAAPWLSLARAYQRTDQVNKAIETLRTASHAVPDDPSIFFTLGKVHIAQDSPSQAQSALERAYQLVSEPQLHGKNRKSGGTQAELFARDREQLCEIGLAYGDILKQLGHPDQALEVLKNAYQAYPAYPGLAYTYAKSILNNGEQGDALAPLAIAVSSHPPYPEPYIEYARALLNARENPQDAVQALEEALSLLGGRTGDQDAELRYLALALLAQGQEAAGQLVPALQTYSQALESPLAHDEQWKRDLSIGMGRVAIQLEQPEIAIAALQGSTRKEIEDPEIAQILCQAYQAISLTQEALYAARSAVHLAPDDVDVLAWFAEQAIALGVTAEAVPALTSAAQLDPQRTAIIIRLAQVQARMGKKEAAREAFLSALSSPYAVPQDLYEAADGLSDLGDREAAADCLERALELQPQPPLDLIIELSDAYNAAEKTELAVKTIDKGINQYPEKALLHAYKADLLARSGRQEAARSCLEHALILEPDDPSLHLQFAFALREQGDLHGALDHALQGVKGLTSSTGSLVARGLAAELTRSNLQEDQFRTLLNSESHPGDDQEMPERTYLKPLSLVDYHCLVAESALEKEEQIAAAGALNEAYNLAPQNPRVLALQSRMALRQGDRGSARDTFDGLMKSFADVQPEDQAPELSSGTLLGMALAAMDLYRWDEASQVIEGSISRYPGDANLHLQKAKLLVLQAEFQRLCQSLEITRHAPGAASLSPRTYRSFEKAIQETVNTLSQDLQARLPLAVERWKVRGKAAFHPEHESIQDLEQLPERPSDQAALITALSQNGDAAAVSRLYHTIKSQAGTDSLHHSIHAAYALALSSIGQDRLSADQAQEAIQSAIEQNPADAIYHVIQAKVAEGHADWPAAMTAMQNALSLWEDEARWHAYLAKILLLNDQFPEAVARYISAIEMEPGYLGNYLDLSQVYLRNGEADRSIEILQEAIKVAPDQVEPYLALASTHYENQNYTQATRNAELAMKIAPDQASPLVLSARIALKVNDPNRAKTAAEAALRIQADDTEAMDLQAQALAGLGDTEGALQVVEKAIPLAPDPLSLHIQRANLLARSDGPNDLLAELKSIAEQYPDEALVLAPLAKALAEAGQKEEAIQAAQQALQRGHGQLPLDEQAQLHQLLGGLLRQAGQLDQSIHQLSEAIRIAPQTLNSYLELALTQEERRQHAAALETYKKAISIYPSDPKPYYQASLLLKASRDYPAAEMMLRKAADRAPDDVNIHRQLAALVALNLVHNRQPVSSEVNQA